MALLQVLNLTNAMTWVAPSEKDTANTTLEGLKKSTLHQAFTGEL